MHSREVNYKICHNWYTGKTGEYVTSQRLTQTQQVQHVCEERAILVTKGHSPHE